jgi:hypothetical protein
MPTSSRWLDAGWTPWLDAPKPTPIRGSVHPSSRPSKGSGIRCSAGGDYLAERFERWTAGRPDGWTAGRPRTPRQLSRTPASAPLTWALARRFKQPPSLVHVADTLGLTASAESKLSPDSSAQGCRQARPRDLTGWVAAPASAVRAARLPEVAR